MKNNSRLEWKETILNNQKITIYFAPNVDTIGKNCTKRYFSQKKKQQQQKQNSILSENRQQELVEHENHR